MDILPLGLISSLMDFAQISRKNTSEIHKLNERLDELFQAIADLARYQRSVEERQNQILSELGQRQKNAEEKQRLEIQNLMLQVRNILLEHNIQASELTLPEPTNTPSLSPHQEDDQEMEPNGSISQSSS